MTPADEDAIGLWHRRCAVDGHLVFESVDTSENESFSLFCDRLQTIAPNIRIERIRASGEALPAIRINDNLRFHIVPEGRELKSFLQALEFQAGAGPPFSDILRRRARRILSPADLTVYVTPSCPVCPQTVADLLPLAFMGDSIQMAMVDGLLFASMAERHDIRSAPTVVLDGRYRWTGRFPLTELLNVLDARDPENPGAAAMENIIKQGRAAEIAAAMRARDRVYPGFIRLIAHGSFSVRLGAMVIAEELANTRPSLMDDVIDPLWESFDLVDDAVRGDILYILGLALSRRNETRLISVLNGPYSTEVKEAARETLEDANWI